MGKSSVFSHDENKRQEFKDKTLRRVYEILNNTKKVVAKNSSSDTVIVKGLQPRNRKED
jgi:hypothetical protein